MLVINHTRKKNQKKNRFLVPLFFFFGFISCTALKAQLREPQLDKRALLQKAQESPTVAYCIKQEQLQNNVISPWDQQEINEQECVVCHRAYAIGDEITIIKSCGHTAHHACITPERTHCPGHQFEENQPQQADTLRPQSSRIEQRFSENTQRREPVPTEQSPPIKRQNRTKMIKKIFVSLGLHETTELNHAALLLQEIFGTRLQQIFPEIFRFTIINNNDNKEYVSTHYSFFTASQLRDFFLSRGIQYLKNIISIIPYIYILTGSLVNIHVHSSLSNQGTGASWASRGRSEIQTTMDVSQPFDRSNTSIFSFLLHTCYSHFFFIIVYDLLIAYTSVNHAYIGQKIQTIGSYLATIGSHVKNKAQAIYSWMTGRAQHPPAAQPVTLNNITGSNIIEQIRARFNRNQQRTPSSSLPSNFSNQEQARLRTVSAFFLKSLFAGVAIKAGAPLFPLIAGFYSSHSAPWNVLIDTMFASYASTIPGATLLYAAGRTAVEYYKQSGINFLNLLIQN